jgi:tRNA (guanine26-N2/guanine27-N2)-dimethyltransferase
MKLKEIIEGKIKLLVPDLDEYKKGNFIDPAWAPVFYNPRMTYNRDISVLIVSTIKPKSVVDALSATGVRGIRYYIEVGNLDTLILNDKNKLAYELMKKNSEINNVNAKIFNRDANSLLFELVVDFVDIDPFGSPIPFVLSSVKAVKKMGHVAYTATDLAPLEGTHKSSCKRRYNVINDKLSFSKEVGLRILIGKIIREAGVIEKAVEPIFSYYADHYYRVYFRVSKGAKRVDGLLDKLGYYYECPKCGYVWSSREYENKAKCPKCDSKIKVAGPLWLDKLNNDELLKELYNNLSKFNYLSNFYRIDNLIKQLISENIYEHYWRLDYLASKLKLNVPKRDKIIECLGDGSYTHFDTRGIKTSKKYEDVIECMKSVSS